MEKVIAIATQKGGCGKTNLAVNLAVALTKEGRSVLIVDELLGSSGDKGSVELWIDEIDAFRGTPSRCWMMIRCRIW